MVIEVADEWEIFERFVCNYCAHGRVQGAFLTGETWNIPEDVEKPIRNVQRFAIYGKEKKKYVCYAFSWR